MEKVPQHGYKIIGLNISGLQRKLTLKNLSFPFKVIDSLNKASKILKDFKPIAAIGVGGYASGPLLFSASRKNIPCLIQEQNSFPGITNKLLASRVQKICVAHDQMNRYFPADKIVWTGNPVRKDIIDVAPKRDEALKFFKLEPAKKVVLAIGGSLGARTINDSLYQKLEKFGKSNVQLIWQTGKFYYGEYKTKLENYDLADIRLLEFLKEMDLAYAAADVVISRAGALSVSELCLAKKPVIFVPSPNVAEDHQTKNAMALVEKNAALMVKDTEARENLVSATLDLVQNETKQQELAGNIGMLGKPDAAQKIVEELFKIIT